MNFELKVDGINPADLIEIQGVDGPFYIGMIGSREELRGGRFYGDRNVQFFFYAKPISMGDGTYVMNVYTATTEMLKGALPDIKSDILSVIIQNIKILLIARDINFPEKVPVPGHIPSDVVFNWGIS